MEKKEENIDSDKLYIEIRHRRVASNAVKLKGMEKITNFKIKTKGLEDKEDDKSGK